LTEGPPPIGGPEHPDEIQVSTSSKEEEEKILRELKEALRAVEEPQASVPTPEPPPPPLPPKYWLAGAVLVILCGLSIVFFLTRKPAKPVTVQPPPTPSESVAPPPVTSGPDTETRASIGKIAAILEAVDKYSRAHNSLPPSLNALNKSYSDQENLKDGWGQNIYYLVDLTNKTFVIRSPGPDRKRETSDDITVTSDNAESWLKEQDLTIRGWRVENPDTYEQLSTIGPSDEDLKKKEVARKAADEKKKRDEEAKKQEAARNAEEENKKREEDLRKQEAARKAEEDKKKQEEELHQAKAREEELRRQAQTVQFKDNFTDGLTQWDAPSSWEIVKDQDLSVLRVQGLGLLKQGESWDNYKMEFEVKINKESGGWVVRAQNTSNFYLFKLGSDKAKAIPKNSLVRYIFSSGKYLNSLKREDAPGAVGVIPLPFKVRNKDFYKVTIAVKGNTIVHYVNGIEVDSWSDSTFDKGRFGFNASIIEMATIRNVSAAPLR
jgi:hypothetical protein